MVSCLAQMLGKFLLTLMPAEFQANVGSGLVRNIPQYPLLGGGEYCLGPIQSEIQTPRAQWRTPNDQ